MALVIQERSTWKWCRDNALEYTRYVDDIAISGDFDFRKQLPSLIARIEAGKYEIASNKVFPRIQGQRQVVTGLVVNEKLRPTKSFLAELKHDIRLCLSTGAELVAEAEGITILKLKNRLNGRIAHVRRYDVDIADHFSGMMHGIVWSNVQTAEQRSSIENANLDWLNFSSAAPIHPACQRLRCNSFRFGRRLLCRSGSRRIGRSF